MKEIIELIKEYNSRHEVNITICLEGDESGICVNSPFENSDDWTEYFMFDSIEELKQKLQQ